MPDENNNKQEISAQIMIAEFELLKDRFLQFRDESIQRFNYYIALSSFLIGGIFVLLSNETSNRSGGLFRRQQ